MAKDYGTEDFSLKPVFFSESDVFISGEYKDNL